MTIEKIFFTHVTWGFLLVNVLIAWIPVGGLLLIGIRELWMPLLVVLLIRNNCIHSLFFLFFIGVIGGVQFTQEFGGVEIISYFYGMRDILLLILVAEMISGKISITAANFNVNSFVVTVIILALLDVIISSILGVDIYKNLFNLDAYYANKGVEIELGFGILGDRVGLPLYSPNLLCTMLAMLFFFDNRIQQSDSKRLLPLIVCVFTATKVLPLTLFYYFTGRRWLAASLVLLVSFFSSFWVLYDLVKDEPLLSYHFASVSGHLSSFATTLASDVISFFPSILGAHSHAIKNMGSNEVVSGLMESMLLARVADLKVWSFALIVYIALMFVVAKNDLGRKALFIFILISLLTATSNQPVAWVPALLVLYHSSQMSSPTLGKTFMWLFSNKKLHHEVS